jgi:hypothetical protein
MRPESEKTLVDAAIEFRRALEKGEKLDCPCCRRYAQIYKRRINKSMAIDLINAVRLKAYRDFVHIRDIQANHSGGGDFAKLRWWKLVEQQTNDDETKRDSGLWKVTQLGLDFMQGLVDLPESVTVYDNEVLSVSDKLKSFKECLKEPFDYQEILRGIE